MKLITFKIKETGSEAPYYKVIEPSKKQPDFMKLESLDKLPVEMPSLTESVYPVVVFAYGKDFRESYYCKPEYQEAIVDMMNGYCNQAKHDLIEEIWEEYGRHSKIDNDFLHFLHELRNKYHA